ncbi:D-xylonolactonase [Abditibacterium utsteinense]|uniref:D-xylonolactonase n=1 Tax=Abditibacterium utsteinense TaxID=1960156 RepID=A0A2S8SQE9_9BACT|nr:SMP-30/gluconolactonase/LRE family protein [Abditibacterium utsteinense]PQV63034.1 D-xylonolactonase [Abditibacterium utsteinense]
MKPNLQPEVLANLHCLCGENPLYDEARGTLYWCDIPPGKVFALDVQSGAHRLIYQGAECGAFSLQSDGNLLIFPGHDALILNPQNGETTLVKTGIVSDTGRFNDCIVDAKGRIFAGTVDWERNNRGGLFRLDSHLQADPICAGTACSNGMAFTPDERGLYWADSSARVVYLFDYDALSGALSNRRAWLETPGFTPDGLTIDSDGNLWIAFFGGSCLRHYDAQAKLLTQVDFPTANITSCIFGGPNLDELYVTSGGGQGETKSDSLAGALFRIRPAVGGQAEFRSQINLP